MQLRIAPSQTRIFVARNNARRNCSEQRFSERFLKRYLFVKKSVFQNGGNLVA